MASGKKKSSGIFDSIRKASGNPKYGRKEFRRDLKKLQRSGLISKKVDVASQAVTKHMLGTIRKFGDVLSGKAQVLTINNPGERKQYKSSGYRTKGTSVVIETPRGEKVRRVAPTSEGTARFEFITKGPQGTRTATRLLIPETDLERYITYLVQDAPDLKRNQFYGIRFYGNNVARYFGGDEAKQRLMAYLLAYADTKHNANLQYDTDNDGDETYRNFEIVEFESKNEWEQGIIEQRKRSRESSRERNRQRYNEWIKKRRMEMTEAERWYENQRRHVSRETDTQRKRIERARIAREEPEKLLEIREKDRLRKQAARRKKK